MMENEMLTASEAANFLRVSKSTLDKLRKEEGLPYVPLGGRVLYCKESLKQYVLDKETNNVQ